MRISDLIRMGLKNLSRRKARTALTVIGVIIGTISIVVMVSIGIGMNSNFKKQIMEMGSLTTITVNKYQTVYDDKGNPIDSKEQKMNDQLVESIKKIPHVTVATPVITKSAILRTGKYENYIMVNAMEASTFAQFGFPELMYGSYPTKDTMDTIIMGSGVVENFNNFSGRVFTQKQIDPAKDKLTISFNAYEYTINPKKKEKKIPLENVAVMTESRGEYDYTVYMDISIFKRWYSEYAKILKPEDRKKAEKSLKDYGQIRVNVDNVKNVEAVQNEIKLLGFSTEGAGPMLKTMEQTSNMMQIVLGGIGAVAMLVSAISIANTMIMSIYERTKEIGVMKVLGCVVTDIKKLFLFEAGMIGLMGGLIGIACSYLASYSINKFGQPVFDVFMNSTMNSNTGDSKFSIIPIWLPVLAALFTMGVGILSGYYPANRATKISAIEAMKTEG